MSKLEYSEIDIEIADSLKTMGIEAARDRLNFFKDEGAITLAEYVKWLHLVNGGGVPKSTPKPKPEDELTDFEKVVTLIIIGVVVALPILVLNAWLAS